MGEMSKYNDWWNNATVFHLETERNGGIGKPSLSSNYNQEITVNETLETISDVEITIPWHYFWLYTWQSKVWKQVFKVSSLFSYKKSQVSSSSSIWTRQPWAVVLINSDRISRCFVRLLAQLRVFCIVSECSAPRYGLLIRPRGPPRPTSRQVLSDGSQLCIPSRNMQRHYRNYC